MNPASYTQLLDKLRLKNHFKAGEQPKQNRKNLAKIKTKKMQNMAWQKK